MCIPFHCCRNVWQWRLRVQRPLNSGWWAEGSSIAPSGKVRWPEKRKRRGGEITEVHMVYTFLRNAWWCGSCILYYTDIHKVYQDILRYTKIYQDILRYTKIYQDIPRYTKIYWGDVWWGIHTFCAWMTNARGLKMGLKSSFFPPAWEGGGTGRAWVESSTAEAFTSFSAR